MTNQGARPYAIYQSDEIDWPAPDPVTNVDGTTVDGGKGRKGKPSIFNRYSLFFVNQQLNNAEKPEDYFDSPNRIQDQVLQTVRREPTAANIIKWSRTMKANASEYAWEDFLWCKNYGYVPNNYMVTLRRFTVPPEDNLFDEKKNANPDIGRMITWVDGESNKWENVGLKWSHNVKYKELTADIQDVQSQPGYGNEAGAFAGLPGGNILKSLASVTDTGASNAKRSHNPNSQSVNPYQNSSVTYGPIDVVNVTHIRDRGLVFEQQLQLTFEYELRSIDGINPRVAMMDLLSNILIVTMNRGAFWGGDVRYYGGNPRQLKPFGNPDLLAKGDYGGYLKSIIDGPNGIVGRLEGLSGGKGLSFEGIATAAKGMAGNLLSQIAGGALDKMGRPGVQAINSLLSGESTGVWHVTVGNPANPIISIGNMILEKTEVDLHGPLGFDDFPTKVKVVCTLKPARPRDRTDIMAMFSRNDRMYLTTPPQSLKTYTGQQAKGGNTGSPQASGGTNEKKNKDLLNPENFELVPLGLVAQRFPNHINTKNPVITESAIGIY